MSVGASRKSVCGRRAAGTGKWGGEIYVSTAITATYVTAVQVLWLLLSPGEIAALNTRRLGYHIFLTKVVSDVILPASFYREYL